MAYTALDGPLAWMLISGLEQGCARTSIYSFTARFARIPGRIWSRAAAFNVPVNLPGLEAVTGVSFGVLESMAEDWSNRGLAFWRDGMLGNKLRPEAVAPGADKH